MTFMLPVQGWISSPFGMRLDPFTRHHAFHSGIDISSKYATGIKTTAGGKVQFAGKRKGYGKLVVISHGDSIETYYGHLGRVFVKKGETVVGGQMVGWTGLTGRTTGPHVHYEIRINNVPINPMTASSFLKNDHEKYTTLYGKSSLDNFWNLLVVAPFMGLL